jgi:hypothetical protein
MPVILAHLWRWRWRRGAAGDGEGVGCPPRDRHRRRRGQERGNENVPLCLAGIRQRLPLVAGDKRLMRTSPVIAPRHLTNGVAVE